jgi:hypothetical protein
LPTDKVRQILHQHRYDIFLREYLAHYLKTEFQKLKEKNDVWQRECDLLHEELNKKEYLLDKGIGTIGDKLISYVIRDKKQKRTKGNEKIATSERQVSAKIEKKTKRNVFLKTGDIWQIVFDGKEIFVKHIDGMLYIKYLLLHPCEEIHATNLYQEVISKSPDNINLTFSKMTNEELIEYGLESHKSAGGIVKVDFKYQDEIKERIDVLTSKIQIAREKDEFEEIMILESEREEMLKYYNASVNKYDRPRKLNSQSNKDRDKVSKAITRALKLIYLKDENTYKYLNDSINRGFKLSYTPTKPIDWDF